MSTDAENGALLQRLGRIAEELDPPPALTYEMGRAALATRTMDAELAELVRDSALDAGALTGVRGTSDVRLLEFQSRVLDVELQLTARGHAHAMLGQVVSDGGTVREVRVEMSHGEVPVPVDASGFFEYADIPAGHFRLRLVPEFGSPVVTRWMAA